jgi:hypothetical protein
MLISFSSRGGSEKTLWAACLPTLRDLPEALAAIPPGFALLLACDAALITPEELTSAVNRPGFPGGSGV